MKVGKLPQIHGLRKIKAKGSSTPGKVKGQNCQATPLQKSFAKRAKSYKWQGYDEWCEQKNGFVVAGMAK